MIVQHFGPYADLIIGILLALAQGTCIGVFHWIIVQVMHRSWIRELLELLVVVLGIALGTLVLSLLNLYPRYQLISASL